MLGALSESQFDALYYQAYFSDVAANNFFLNDVNVTSVTNFNRSQFIADVLEEYHNTLERNGLVSPRWREQK